VALRALAGLPDPAAELGPGPVGRLAALGDLIAQEVGGGAAVALLGKGQRSERPVVTRAEWKALAARIDTAATDMTGLATDLKLLRDQVAQGREAADRWPLPRSATAAPPPTAPRQSAPSRPAITGGFSRSR
jgi:hypothetical protein